MLVLGKGLGGGVFPLAALLAREDLDIMPEGALGHYTHEKNPVASAAALATIECLEDDGLLENSERIGAHALARMQELKEKHQIVGDVRGLGLLLGIECERPAREVRDHLLERRILVGTSLDGNTIRLLPPLVIGEDAIERLTSALENV